MTKREIDRKFDEIVDFAGVEKFIDTPVKRYSSGIPSCLAGRQSRKIVEESLERASCSERTGMSEEVTLTLPDGLFERAQLWASQSGRPVADFLMQTIEASLLPLGQVPKPVIEWTGDEVLSAVDSHLCPDVDQRLSELLARQPEGSLSGQEAKELERLMLVYQEGLLTQGNGSAQRPCGTVAQGPGTVNGDVRRGTATARSRAGRPSM